MIAHPALLMVLVWGVVIGCYLVLPFRLVDSELTSEGGVLLAVFLLSFIGASLLAPKTKYKYEFSGHRKVHFPFEILLQIACCIAVVAGVIELLNSSLALEEAYVERDKRASDLAKGASSSSTLSFQILFLSYPAAFVLLAKSIVFSERFEKINILVLGALPVVFAALIMGGRAPLLYGLCIVVLSVLVRVKTRRRISPVIKKKRWLYGLGLMVVCFAAFYYFAAVFLVRAQASAGGVEQMFQVAENVWGVGFDGVGAETLFSVFGNEIAYLIFIFAWYFVQGFVMSNVIFTGYEGPAQLGIYGVDLVSALMRRIDGELVGSYFGYLFDLGTYGFLPSAFGSLYVDFKLWGVIFVLLWGWFSGFVYQKSKTGLEIKWNLFVPFLSAGIFFSAINTPLGFTNGFVTYCWLVLLFLSVRETFENAEEDKSN